MSENLQSAPCSTGQRHSRRHFETCQYSTVDFVRHIHRSQCKLAIQEYRPWHNSSHTVRRTDNHWLLSRRPIQSYITLPWSCPGYTSRLPRIHLKIEIQSLIYKIQIYLVTRRSKSTDVHMSRVSSRSTRQVAMLTFYTVLYPIYQSIKQWRHLMNHKRPCRDQTKVNQ